ncbi:hypothetical protein F2P56_006921 [Juglans regia]|uniref:TPR1-like CTLH-containing domain-containing protein n=2 Tax=Juglans regia TaxID=51240 RepID=A0A833XRK8_JUGRE|nr:hypothetical protein F2P56_006921 [Juglans regia]
MISFSHFFYCFIYFLLFCSYQILFYFFHRFCCLPLGIRVISISLFPPKSVSSLMVLNLPLSSSVSQRAFLSNQIHHIMHSEIIFQAAATCVQPFRPFQQASKSTTFAGITHGEWHDRSKAVDILVKDLIVFATFNEELFKEITQLLTLENFREEWLKAI